MEQRQVRLGDVLDDYCTRERRVTNHAVVALVGNEVKLTRCTTCDTEHPYKAARVPPRRQTKLVAARSTATTADGPAPALQGPNAKGDAGAVVGTPLAAMPLAAVAASVSPAEVDDTAIALRVDSVRRPLIRATLQRPEGTPPPVRQAPVFTIRENSGRDSGAERGARPGRKGRGAGRIGVEPNGNRVDGHSGQPARPSIPGKNGAKPFRARAAANRPDRANRSQPRSRGKGRSH